MGALGRDEQLLDLIIQHTKLIASLAARVKALEQRQNSRAELSESQVLELWTHAGPTDPDGWKRMYRRMREEITHPYFRGDHPK